MINTYSFKLTIYDYPRYRGLINTLKSQKISLNDQKEYMLPIIEEFEPISVFHSTLLPKFIYFDGKYTYTLNPNQTSHLGTFFIKGTILNKYLSRNF